MTRSLAKFPTKAAAVLTLGLLVGATVAVVLTLGRGTRYSAAATAYLDPATSPYSYNAGDPAIQIAAVNSFTASVFGQAGITSLAERLKMEPGTIRSNANVERLGVTNDVRVVFTATTAAKAEQGATAVASAGVAGYNAASHTIVLKRVQVYQAFYDGRTADLLSYIKQTGEPAPDVAYGAVLNQITNLAVVSPQAPGTPRLLRELAARRDRLANILPRYRDLSAAQQRAGATLQTAEGQATALEAAQESAAAGIGIDVSAATRTDTPRRAATNGFLGGLAGLLVAGLVMGTRRAVAGTPGDLSSVGVANPEDATGYAQAPPKHDTRERAAQAEAHGQSGSGQRGDTQAGAVQPPTHGSDPGSSEDGIGLQGKEGVADSGSHPPLRGAAADGAGSDSDPAAADSNTESQPARDSFR